MTEKERKEIGKRLTSRVFTGVTFIESNYLDLHSTPDPAWIRNIYILLSFYSELLFKAILVMRGTFTGKVDLDNKLRLLSHNLEVIGKEIGPSGLKTFGIKNVSFINHEYHIETEDGDFYVKDFTDIRYDFLDDRVRVLKGDEHKMFETQIEIMLKINSKLKLLVWGK